MGKRDNNRGVLDMLGGYFWDVGLSLAVAGTLLIFTNAMGVFVAGIILFFTAVFIKALRNHKNA